MGKDYHVIHEMNKTQHQGKVMDLSFSEDGRYFASVSTDQNLIIQDTELQKPPVLFQGHTKQVETCIWVPGSNEIVSCSKDGNLYLWALTNKKIVPRKISIGKWVYGCQFTPDGSRLLAVAENMTYLINTRSLKIEKTFSAKYGLFSSWTLSPAGRFLLTGCDSIAQLWDLNSGKHLINNPIGMTGDVMGVSFSPDARMIVLGSGKLFGFQGGKIGQFTLEEIGELNNYFDMGGYIVLPEIEFDEEITFCKFSPDGRQILVGFFNQDLRIWDLKKGNWLTKMSNACYKGRIAIFSQDAKYIITAASTCIKLYKSSNGSMITQISIEGSSALTMESKTKKIAVGDIYGAIHLLRIMGIEFAPSYVTATYLYRFSKQAYDKTPTVLCPACGHRYFSPKKVLDTIEEITKKAGLKKGQSPCFELPDEAWEEPGLLSECPKCKEKLRFNPFIAGGEDY